MSGGRYDVDIFFFFSFFSKLTRFFIFSFARGRGADMTWTFSSFFCKGSRSRYDEVSFIHFPFFARGSYDVGFIFPFLHLRKELIWRRFLFLTAAEAFHPLREKYNKNWFRDCRYQISLRQVQCKTVKLWVYHQRQVVSISMHQEQGVVKSVKW